MGTNVTLTFYFDHSQVSHVLEYQPLTVVWSANFISSNSARTTAVLSIRHGCLPLSPSLMPKEPLSFSVSGRATCLI
jgi:hypothetical protein